MDVVEANAFSKLRGLAVKKLLTAKIAKDCEGRKVNLYLLLRRSLWLRASQGYPNVLILYTFLPVKWV